jgi:hypothetical protein
MFVLEALVLTFLTTPLVTALYPPHMRVRASGTEDTLTAVAGAERAISGNGPRDEGKVDRPQKTQFTVVLDKIEYLPGMMALVQLIQPLSTKDADSKNIGSSKTVTGKTSEIFIDALRLTELSDRP